MNLRLFFPSHTQLEDATVRVVAGGLLKLLVQETMHGERPFHGGNILLDVKQSYQVRSWECVRAVSEALAWLSAQCLTCQAPDQNPGWSILTRAGIAAAQASNFEEWSADRDLPSTLLHATIVRECMDSFRLGRFDTAVFEGFKALEIAIREAAGLGAGDVGVALARKAFHPNDGPLTDMAQEGGERQALADLMAGALGSYKNPHSHRKVEIGAAEAREMLILASHLLRIVEMRAS